MPAEPTFATADDLIRTLATAQDVWIKGSHVSGDTMQAFLEDLHNAGAAPSAWVAGPPSNPRETLATLFPHVPIPELPEPVAEAPLRSALQAWAESRGLPSPDPLLLDAAITRLGIDADAERAVALLVLAHREADVLQRAALARLDPEEVALLSLDPEAVQGWLLSHPDADLWELHEHLLDLTTRVDVAKNLQAAALLAIAVEHAREILSAHGVHHPPGGEVALAVDGLDPSPSAWDLPRQTLLAALGAAPPETRELGSADLTDSLRSLALATGAPDPGPLEVPTVPPAVGAALARLASAHAFALTHPDALDGGFAIFDAAEAAEPALVALAEMQRFRSTGNPPVERFVVGAPGGLGQSVLREWMGIGDEEAEQLERSIRDASPDVQAAFDRLLSVTALMDQAVSTVLWGLAAEESAALAQAAHVERLLGRANWNQSDAYLVADYYRGATKLRSTGILAYYERWVEAAQDLRRVLPGPHPGPRPAAGLVQSGDAGGCGDEVGCRLDLLRALSTSGGDLETGSSGIIPGALDPVLDGVQEILGALPEDPFEPIPSGLLPGEVVGVVEFARTVLGNAGYPPALPADDEPLVTIDHPLLGPDAPALLVIGDVDSENFTRRAHLLVDLGGDDRYTVPVGTRTDLLLELAGNDTYDTPDLEETQGFAEGLGVAALLDLAGDDIYRAAARSQGSACCGAGVTVSTRADVDNATRPAAGSTGGIGLLFDRSGNDTYEAGPQSQGYASAAWFDATDLLAGGKPARGVAGFLLDREGDDQYTFARQGSAESQASATPFGPERRPVGWFVDVAGNDTYTSAFVVADPDDEDSLFATQGNATSRGTEGQIPSTPLGVFADLSGSDHYLTLTQTGLIVEVSEAKNDQVRSKTSQTDEGGLPLGLYVDVTLGPETLQGQDSDGDGSPDLLEDLFGSDPGDGGDGGLGALIGNGLALPSGNETDETYLLRIPTLSGPGRDLGLTLPGLVIAGRGDDIHSEDFDLFIDLGGNDTYRGPTHGGGVAVLFSEDQLVEGYEASGVRLAVDLGDGDDRYEPEPRELFSQDPINNAVLLAASNPNLGGAHTGVGVVADLGGQNRFRSSLVATAYHELGGSAEQSAMSMALGTSQGAGIYGGVGWLMTFDASNEFVSEVLAEAFDPDALPSTRAVAAGVSQGAGWAGIGLHTTFGQGTDNRTIDVDAYAPPGRSESRLGMAQGGAWNGIGVAIDGGGDDRYVSKESLAQGAAWADRRDPADATFDYGLVGLQLDGFNDGGLPVALGLLWDGAGNDTYHAADVAQAAAGSSAPIFHGLNTGRDQGPLGPQNLADPKGGRAVALLLDGGGGDTYTASASEGGGSVLAQAAAVNGGVALLLDAAGDDIYTLQGGSGQASALGAVAVLADLAGQDRYTATRDSQGHATDARAARQSLQLCTGPFLRPCSSALSATEKQSPNEDVVDTQQRSGAIAILFEGEGLDRFTASERSQGYAESDRLYMMRLAHCRSRHGDVGEDKEPYLRKCPDGYPGTKDPDGKKIEYIPDEPVGPPVHGPVLGLFLDAGNTDLYDYSGTKVPALGEGEEVPSDHNGWTWRQQLVTEDTMGDTRLPQSPFDEDAAAPVDQVADAYPTAWPDPVAALPIPPATAGIGIDAEALAAGLAAVRDVFTAAGLDAPLRIDVKIARDPEGTDRVGAGEHVAGTVYLLADVQLGGVPLATVRSMDLFADGIHLGPGEQVSGGPDDVRYRFEWVTRRSDDIPFQEAYPDGDYTVIAVARVGVDGAERSVESPPETLALDNPPLVMVTAGGNFSALSGGSASVTVSIGSDYDFPQGESGSTPGGHLTLRVIGPQSETVLVDAYNEAGSNVSAFTGRCDGDPCPDGLYRFNATVVDGAGQTAQSEAQVFLDSTPPSSQLGIGPFVGLDRRALGTQMLIDWSASDGDGPATGVSDVSLLFVAQDGTAQRLGDGPLPWPKTREWTYGPVLTGQTFRFITVAGDAVGNSESPCQEGETPPCYRAKVAKDPGALVETMVDFDRPRVLDAASEAGFLRPGITESRFTVEASDAGSGIEAAFISFGGSDVFEMTSGEEAGTFHFDDWHQHNAGLEAQETPHVYTVRVVDRAGNPGSGSGVVVLDELKPRVTPLVPSFVESPLGGDRLPLGRPGVFALLEVHVEDAAVAAATAQLDGLDPGQTLGLRYDATRGLWSGTALVPAGTLDGEYDVPLVVTDQAGNVEDGASVTLVIEGTRVPVQDLQAVAVSHDTMRVTWQTAEPTSGILRYGRGASLGRQIPLDPALATVHEVVLKDLQAGTLYQFQVVSRSASGVLAASEVVVARTASAVDISLEGIVSGSSLRGVKAVTLNTSLPPGFTGDIASEIRAAPVDGSFSPVPLAEHRGPPGDQELSLDFRRLADGPWILQAVGRLGSDLNEVDVATIHVDNNAPILFPVDPLPGGGVANATPTLHILLQDPGGVPDAPWKEMTSVWVDDRKMQTIVTTQSASRDFGPGALVLSAQIPETLRDGAHSITARARDLAGNEGEVSWGIQIDTRGPVLVSPARILPDAGLGMASPGGGVTVSATLEDVSGLAAAWIDGGSVAAGEVRLLGTGGLWEGRLALAEDLPGGAYALDLHALDGLGNEEVYEAAIVFAVDATPPALISVSTVPDLTSVGLSVTASEPVTLLAEVFEDDVLAASASSDEADAEHSLEMEGLRPAMAYPMRITATDRGGLQVQREILVRTPDDPEDPGPVRHLRTASPEEGVAVVSWDAARDNAGLDRYEVWRSDTRSWEWLTPDAGSHRFTTDPGREVSVFVRAVDLAGRTGAASQAALLVLALPSLEDPLLPSGVVDSGEDVRFGVTYRHASGAPAEYVRLHLGDTSFPMETDDISCRQGCRYTATVRVPATSFFETLRDAWFEAGDGVNVATTTPVPAPLSVDSAPDDALPVGLGPLPALMALAGALFVLSRRRGR